MRQPVEMEQLEEAAFELARQFERIAQEACGQNDIYGVAFAVQQLQRVHRMAHNAKRRFGK